MKLRLLTILLAATVGCAPSPTQKTQGSNRLATSQVTVPKTDAETAIERIEQRIELTRRQAKTERGWFRYQQLSGLFTARARLTGEIEDYINARQAIERAFEESTETTGPFMARAGYNFTTHNVNAVESDLRRAEQKVLLKNTERAAIDGMRGDVAFHTANLAQARSYYKKSEALVPTMASAARLGNLCVKTADYTGARRWYDIAIERVNPSSPVEKSWALLHRGIVELEAGKVRDALPYYHVANEAFTGWYLVQEHIAEARLLTGDFDGALALYEDIVTRVPNGEFYSALADTYSEVGNRHQAKLAIQKATSAFDRDLEILPSAASGHALDFFIEHDPKRAVELAEHNFLLRASYEATVQLSAAQLAFGNLVAARKTLKPVLDSEWATGDFLELKKTLF